MSFQDLFDMCLQCSMWLFKTHDILEHDHIQQFARQLFDHFTCLNKIYRVLASSIKLRNRMVGLRVLRMVTNSKMGKTMRERICSISQG